MKKKTLTILITMCLLMIIGIGKVNADVGIGSYNGTSTNFSGATGKNPCPNSENLCPYGNQISFSAVRISLYYINGAKKTKVKTASGATVKQYYIANTIPNDYDNWIKDSDIGLNVMVGREEFNKLSARVANYLGATDDGFLRITDPAKFKKSFKKIFKVDFDNVDFHEDSQYASKEKTATHGYRIIIEPVFQYSTKSGYYYLTAKEASSMVAKGEKGHTAEKLGDGSTSLQETSRAFLTSIDDVGITQFSKKTCEDGYNTIAGDENNGCGYNIIDISNVVQKCYEKTITGSLTCEKIDANNESLFSEHYKETNCSGMSKEEQKNTADGKIVAEGDKCNLYCTESALASFPGGFSKDSQYYNGSVRLGGYFQWPKPYDSPIFNMHMTSILTCRIVAKSGNTCSSEEIIKLVNSASSYLDSNLKYSAQLTGGTYQPITGAALVEKKSKTTKPSEVKTMDGGTKTELFEVRRTVYFEINDTTNRYYNLSTGEVSSTFQSGLNIQDRQAGVISHSMNDDTNKEYELKISGVVLGSGNEFGKRINDGTGYVCKYRLDDSCKCPDDTCDAGKDLREYVEYYGYSCQEAQTKKCNERGGTKKIVNTEKEICNYTCKHRDGSGETNITTCVEKEYATGKYATKEDAVEKCSSKVQACAVYTCSNDASVDITSCVQQQAPGKNILDNPEEIAAAIKVCEEEQKKNGRCTNSCASEVARCQIESPGKSLYECQTEKNPSCKNKSISELKECLDNCPATCYYKGQPIPQYLDCVNNGGNASACYDAWCYSDRCMPGEVCEYCLDTVTGEKVDTTKCVTDKLTELAKTKKNVTKTDKENIKLECAKAQPRCNNGNTCKLGCKWESEVKGKTTYYYKKCADSTEICETKAVYCSGKNCQKIVYRTIDLNNPFPGKNGKGETKDFSNGGTGRYPNSNWNSIETVKTKILNARGVKGDEIFDKTKVTPLYTIILTPENTKKIKSSTAGYNKENSYEDFTLKCNGASDHDACVSSFLHSGQYVTIDAKNSACGNINNAEEFYACYERIN